MSLRYAFTAVLFTSLLQAQPAPPSNLADSAQRKLDLIMENRAKPGSIIMFTSGECNAWAHARLPALVPKGIRNEMLEFGTDTITGSALINFLAVREGLGQTNGAIMRRLLDGERAVKALVRLASENGKATVYLLRLEVGGAAMSGTMLDLLIDDVLKTVYPAAKVNEPIVLDYRIDRIEVRPTGIRVVIKK